MTKLLVIMLGLLGIGIGLSQAWSQRPVSSSGDSKWCSAHLDAAPSADHPECYCESDDASLPSGEGC